MSEYIAKSNVGQCQQESYGFQIGPLEAHWQNNLVLIINDTRTTDHTLSDDWA